MQKAQKIDESKGCVIVHYIQKKKKYLVSPDMVFICPPQKLKFTFRQLDLNACSLEVKKVLYLFLYLGNCYYLLKVCLIVCRSCHYSIIQTIRLLAVKVPFSSLVQKYLVFFFIYIYLACTYYVQLKKQPFLTFDL